MSVITTLNLKVMGQKLVGKSGYIQRTEPRISDCALFERLLIAIPKHLQELITWK